MARWFSIVTLLLYAACSVYAVVSHGFWMSLIGASLALAGAAGLFRLWPWSQYAVYALSFSMFLEWLYVLWVSRSVWMVEQASAGQRVIVFIPGLVMMGLCAFVSWSASRLFHKKA